MKSIEGEGKVVLRYEEGKKKKGQVKEIEGIVNERGNVMGMMKNKEKMIEEENGGDEGREIFEGEIGIKE